MKTLRYLLYTLLMTVIATSCIEDGVDNSPSAQPRFSVDTLKMGTFFTGQPTPTFRFTVHNRNSKIINISSIALRDGSTFRVNVDGLTGTTFSNIEIRPGDSIYVFVEATVAPLGTPVAGKIEDHLDFVTNGVTRDVVLSIIGQDVTRERGTVIDADTRWEAEQPYQIFDSLVVAPDATLTLAPGTTLCFHDKATMRIYGSLVTEGTPEAPVNMTGDRTDNVVGDISFDLMASQWNGLYFAPESRGNRLSHTVVRNTVTGVQADSLSSVEFVNCRLRNSAGYALVGYHADITAIGSEIADAAEGTMLLHGGTATVNHCTFANYYLFAALRGPAVQFSHVNSDTDDGSELPLLSARFTNSIIYGLGTDLSIGDFDGTDVYFDHCLFKSSGEDDEHFIMSIWDEDPLYYTVREDYVFDYQLRPESPAAEAGDPALTLPAAAIDFHAVPRDPALPSIGAYQFVLHAEEE